MVKAFVAKLKDFYVSPLQAREKEERTRELMTISVTSPHANAKHRFTNVLVVGAVRVKKVNAVYVLSKRRVDVEKQMFS